MKYQNNYNDSKNSTGDCCTSLGYSYSLGKDCEGHEIIPLPNHKLVVKTNRHPTTDGFLWGWIEGTTRNTVWGDDSKFNKTAAEKLAREYNTNNNL